MYNGPNILFTPNFKFRQHVENNRAFLLRPACWEMPFHSART